eukprot:TRINITY_DN183022_c1_g1_i1.p1 TRINITY_DN183022_c1_g1~~TRINITY_DN183022_c1_g1_i1.p1  ORF type:complete len:174 (-),score=24.49 TRINITY_DN183022_c1_g1_i1:50-571(-)
MADVAEGSRLPLTKPIFQRVSDVSPNHHAINLHVKVVSIGKAEEKEKKNGSVYKLGEAVVGDSTGVITMTLRDEQCDVFQVGNYVKLQNAAIRLFRGNFRIEVDRWGKMSVVVDDVPQWTPNLEKDMSAFEFDDGESPDTRSSPPKRALRRQRQQRNKSRHEDDVNTGGDDEQ